MRSNMTALVQNPTFIANHKTNIILKNRNPNLLESQVKIPSPHTTTNRSRLQPQNKKNTQITKILGDELGNHLA